MIFLKILGPVLISALCLFLASRNVHWGELKTILASARMLPIAICILIQFLTFWLRAKRWKILLDPFQKIQTQVLCRWQIGALLINYLLPLRIGEFARAYWAGHKSSLSKSTLLATIVVERIMDISSIGCVGVSILFITGFYRYSRFLTLKNLMAVVAIAVLAYALCQYLWKKYSLSIYEKIKQMLPEKIAVLVEKFMDGLKIFQDKGEVLKVFGLSIVIWSVDIALIAVFSRTLGLNLSWMQAGLLLTGLLLGVMIPAAPGAAGTYEAGGMAAMVMMGVDKTLGFSFIIFMHGFQFLLMLVLGIPILILEGFHPKMILAEFKKKGS